MRIIINNTSKKYLNYFLLSDVQVAVNWGFPPAHHQPPYLLVNIAQ